MRRQAQAKLSDIEERIRDLRRIRDALVRLVDACHGDGPASGCPILGALATTDDEGKG